MQTSKQRHTDNDPTQTRRADNQATEETLQHKNTEMTEAATNTDDRDGHDRDTYNRQTEAEENTHRPTQRNQHTKHVETKTTTTADKPTQAHKQGLMTPRILEEGL